MAGRGVDADVIGACTVVGRDVARDGAALGEALSGLRATYHLVLGTPPAFEATEALSVAWSEATLQYLHDLSCEDPLTGLASLAHVRTRLDEIYREADLTDVGRPRQPRPGDRGARFAARRRGRMHHFTRDHAAGRRLAEPRCAPRLLRRPDLSAGSACGGARTGVPLGGQALPTTSADRGCCSASFLCRPRRDRQHRRPAAVRLRAGRRCGRVVAVGRLGPTTLACQLASDRRGVGARDYAGAMCGRYASSRKPEDLVEEFEIATSQVDEALAPDYNVAPTKEVYAVVERPPSPRDAERARSRPSASCGCSRWGLVPSWAKDPSIGNRMINARMETVAEKPAYKRAFASRRCLLPGRRLLRVVPHRSRPAKSGKPLKQPFFIRPTDGGVLAMAGLYEIWRDPDKAEDDPDRFLWTCTVHHHRRPRTTSATSTTGCR